MVVGRGQRDVAAVAVADQHGLAPIEQPDEIADLCVHRERAIVRERSAVAATVVAQDSEVLVEAAAELQHAGRAVHRPVDHDDERIVRRPGLLGPQRGSRDAHDPQHVGRGAARTVGGAGKHQDRLARN